MADFKGLDRLSALQGNRFGMASSVRAPGANRVAGSAGANYRRQAEDYNTATRLLRRQARRGDAGSALDLIRVREMANERGFTPGGIRSKEEFDASAAGTIQAQERGAADRERAAMLMRQQAAEQSGDMVPDALGAPAAPTTGIGATVMPESRTSAALDILGGQIAGDDTTTQRGLDSATRLGVKDPVSILRGDKNLTFRKTLDSALGKAKSPAEIAMLKSRATQGGIDSAAFDRRVNWWDKKRSI